MAKKIINEKNIIRKKQVLPTITGTKAAESRTKGVTRLISVGKSAIKYRRINFDRINWPDDGND